MLYCRKVSTYDSKLAATLVQTERSTDIVEAHLIRQVTALLVLSIRGLFEIVISKQTNVVKYLKLTRSVCGPTSPNFRPCQPPVPSSILHDSRRAILSMSSVRTTSDIEDSEKEHLPAADATR